MVIIRALFAMSLLVLTLPAIAQEAAPANVAPTPEVITAAKAVIEASGGRAEALKAMSSIKSTYLAQLRGQDPAMLERVQGVLTKLMDEKNPRIAAYLDEMESSALEFYATRFTADELKAISTFQMSPAGKKFRTVVPELMAVMQPPMMRFQQALSQDLQREIQSK
jgi:hypothetical protein